MLDVASQLPLLWHINSLVYGYVTQFGNNFVTAIHDHKKTREGWVVPHRDVAIVIYSGMLQKW